MLYSTCTHDGLRPDAPRKVKKPLHLEITSSWPSMHGKNDLQNTLLPEIDALSRASRATKRYEKKNVTSAKQIEARLQKREGRVQNVVPASEKHIWGKSRHFKTRRVTAPDIKSDDESGSLAKKPSEGRPGHQGLVDDHNSPEQNAPIFRSSDTILTTIYHPRGGHQARRSHNCKAQTNTEPKPKDNSLFLQHLPCEIRLLIYEHLFRSTQVTVHTILDDYYHIYDWKASPRRYRTYSSDYSTQRCTALLQTCSTINAEARPMFARYATFHALEPHERCKCWDRRGRFPHISNLTYVTHTNAAQAFWDFRLLDSLLQFNPKLQGFQLRTMNIGPPLCAHSTCTSCKRRLNYMLEYGLKCAKVVTFEIASEGMTCEGPGLGQRRTSVMMKSKEKGKVWMSGRRDEVIVDALRRLLVLKDFGKKVEFFLNATGGRSTPEKSAVVILSQLDAIEWQ